LGFTPFANADSRSNVVIAVNYLPGIDDKKFRELISTKFKVLIAGGFGELKGKVFRVGCMGEVASYHVMRTLSSIASSMSILGVPPIKDGLSIANKVLSQ
jgi:aspartate aminotransferase-like enzyme